MGGYTLPLKTRGFGYWLKITNRINYKCPTLTYKVVTTTRPAYFHNLISVQRPRSTRSSSVVTNNNWQPVSLQLLPWLPSKCSPGCTRPALQLAGYSVAAAVAAYTGCGNKKDPTTKTAISLKRLMSFKGKFSRLLRTIVDTKGVNFIKFHYYMQKWYEL